MRRSILVVALATLFMAPTIAAAHVNVTPDIVEGGGEALVTFTVPNERDVATTGLQVVLPEDIPIGGAQVSPKEGWESAVVERPDGTVESISWESEAGITVGGREEFPVQLTGLPREGELLLRALQTYADGETVRWIEPTVNGIEPARPAPLLTLTAPPGEAAEPSAAPETVEPTVEIPDPETNAPAEDFEPVEDDRDRTWVYVLAAVLVAVSIGALLWRRR